MTTTARPDAGLAAAFASAAGVMKTVMDRRSRGVLFCKTLAAAFTVSRKRKGFGNEPKRMGGFLIPGSLVRVQPGVLVF
jgi:hypothetical protein